MDELIGSGLREELYEPARLAGAAITSVAAALPERSVGNEEIARRIGVDSEWIVERTGVESRGIAGPGERVTEFAARAGSAALAGAGVEPEDVDLVLVATMSHDYLTPSAAPLAARAMGCDRAGAVDLSAACTGFLSALALATAQIESGRTGAALVIGADVLSRHTDPEDRGTAALFGDGAGAAVVRRCDGGSRVGPVVLGADGARAELIEAAREEGLIRMKGPDTYRQAVDRLSESSLRAAELAGCGLEDVDLFVFHQANGRILTAVGERLGIPEDRVVNSIRTTGNTSAASIPVALAQAEAEGRLAPGARVLLAAFGGGLTWGGTVVEWGAPGPAEGSSSDGGVADAA
jgi:3-oxoacyl-[acyl-carrier-protein] synthase-3